MSHAQFPDHPRTISLTHLIVPDPWEFCRDVQNIAYDWISARTRGQSVARPFEEPVKDNGDSGQEKVKHFRELGGRNRCQTSS